MRKIETLQRALVVVAGLMGLGLLAGVVPRSPAGAVVTVAMFFVALALWRAEERHRP